MIMITIKENNWRPYRQLHYKTRMYLFPYRTLIDSPLYWSKEFLRVLIKTIFFTFKSLTTILNDILSSTILMSFPSLEDKRENQDNVNLSWDISSLVLKK